MESENAIWGEEETDEEPLDFDELEKMLESQRDAYWSSFQFSKQEKEQIQNPEQLSDAVERVVWEQIRNQIAQTAGNDFITENGGMTLDLRKSAHIQTAENFANGKIATHNKKVDYQQRYDDWQSNFKKDENGQVITRTDRRSGQEKAVLTGDARKKFDQERPKGSGSTDMDHTISAAEIIRDPKANAFMSKDEQIAFANSDKNLNPLDSAANRSKGDSSMDDWLGSTRDGQTPAERFDIDEEQLRQKDKEARDEYEKKKNEGEEFAIKTGKQSRREEAFRITGKALRAVALQLLSELVKEILGKMVQWFKSGKRNLDSLLANMKTAISSFVHSLKDHLINAGDTLFTTIAQAILGPVVGVLKKTWMLLKQGWMSLKEAVSFWQDPQNRYMPFSRKVLEVGKIVIAGLSASGAIVLGETIEAGLMTIPVFAVEIPLLGSLASLIGIFMGALIAGVLGAIAINLIDQLTAKQHEKEINSDQMYAGNKILSIQEKLYNLNVQRANQTMHRAANSISKRHNDTRQKRDEVAKSIFSYQPPDMREDLKDLQGKLKKLMDD